MTEILLFLILIVTVIDVGLQVADRLKPVINQRRLRKAKSRIQ